MRRACQRHARGLSRSSVLRYIYWKMKDYSIAFYQHSTCLPSPNSSLVVQQLLDSDGHIYHRKKDKDSALKSAWQCIKHTLPTKCPCRCYLTLSDDTLALSKKTHTHEADIAAPERQEVLVSLKRKAADKPLLATQNLISEALVETSPALNQIRPNIMSLARVILSYRQVECW